MLGWVLENDDGSAEKIYVSVVRDPEKGVGPKGKVVRCFLREIRGRAE